MPKIIELTDQLSQMQLPVPNNSNHSQATTTSYQPATSTAAPIWAQLFYEDVRLIFDSAYEEIVFWRKNLFMLPSGAAGKSLLMRSPGCWTYGTATQRLERHYDHASFTVAET